METSSRIRTWLLILSGMATVVIGLALYFLLGSDQPAAEAIKAPPDPAAQYRGKLVYDHFPIGDPVVGHPMITHVAIIDVDGDGLADVVVCDGLANSVRWIRQFPRGVFTERSLGDPVQGPAHVAACDLNGTGKLDLLVASMGVIMPDNDKIGSIVVMENLGGGRFHNHMIATDIARVTDVRAANLAGHTDGKLDLVVGQFGYVQGEIRWMENLGNWQFKTHSLLSAQGTIHTPVADFDGSGRASFAALISKGRQEVRLFRNVGEGNFEQRTLWKSTNDHWGSSGLEVCDLNGDGKPDLISTNGDGFSWQADLPPWHGLQWLENLGAGEFKYHRIGDYPGAYSPICVDLDGTGHRDIVTVSAFNDWKNPDAVSLMAWMNDGQQHFTPVPLAHAPTHLITVAAGDLDGDGSMVLVTGGFHIYPPWSEMSRVTIWRRRRY